MSMSQAKGSKNITGHNGFELGDAYLAIACQSAKSNSVISLHTRHASVTKVLSAQILSKQWDCNSNSVWMQWLGQDYGGSTRCTCLHDIINVYHIHSIQSLQKGPFNCWKILTKTVYGASAEEVTTETYMFILFSFVSSIGLACTDRRPEITIMVDWA